MKPLLNQRAVTELGRARANQYTRPNALFQLLEGGVEYLQRLFAAADVPPRDRARAYAGRFGGQNDTGYVTFVLATLTLLGLWLVRDVRRHLELDW